MLTLTPTQMLAMVKRQLLLQPLQHDCTIERADGLDIDSFLLERIEQWYRNLLLTADTRLLPVDDVRNETSLSRNADNSITALIPARVVRPVEVQLASWSKPVTAFLKPDDDAARFQFNTFLRGRTDNPAVIDFHNRWLLFSANNGDNSLLTARAVVRPDNGLYIFDSAVKIDIPLT